MSGNDSLNNLLFTQSLLSTAHGFWICASLITSIPLLFDLNIFSDSNLQPDDPGIYCIIEICLAGASFLVALVGSFTTLASKSRETNPLTQYTLGSFYVIFFIICSFIAFLRLNKLGLLAEWELTEEAGTCRDSSFTGNPIARLELAGYKVETISDCQFNVYDPNLVNINIFGNGTNNPILVDWSNPFNYDAANANVLAQAAQSAGADVDAAAMPLLHEFWYWGCDPVCHPRHKLNFTWLIYSIVNSGVYLILLIVSFAAGVESNRNNKLSTKKNDDLEMSQTSPDAESDEEDDEELQLLINKRSLSSMRF